MTKGANYIQLRSDALSTRSMARSIAAHELNHMADFSTQSLLVKNGMNTKSLNQYINFTEQNSYSLQLSTASKYSISGNFWMEARKFSMNYGLTTYPNTYSLKQILNNIW